MRREIRKHEIQAPIYDPNETPIMDNIRIRELLPHRYPMQLVDKVVALGATSIVGVKNRLFIFVDWMWSYFTYDPSLRIIIKPLKRE